MKPFTRWYQGMSYLSALIAISAQGFILQKPEVLVKFDVPTYLVTFLTTSATYLLVYRVAIWLFQNWLWKVLLRKYNLSGTWYHRIDWIENTERGDQHRCRIGITHVRQDVFSCHFLVATYDPSLEPSTLTLLTTEAITIDDTGRLRMTYQTVRSKCSDVDPVFSKEGIVVGHIHLAKGGHPSQIKGVFMDTYPAKVRGSITWARSASWEGELESDRLELENCDVNRHNGLDATGNGAD